MPSIYVSEKDKAHLKKEKLHMKFLKTLHEHTCWEAFVIILDKIRTYAFYEMYLNREGLPEREHLASIHYDLQNFMSSFISMCRNRETSGGDPSDSRYITVREIKNTEAYKALWGLTNQYACHVNLTGHNSQNPKIYYKKPKANLNTKHNKNKFSYFKRKLSQLERCGARKVKNTPFDFVPYKIVTVNN